METTAVDVDQLAVAHALERVISWLRDSREPAGLSASAISALVRLESLGSLRVTELSAREGLTQPGMTTLINRLEDAGLAIREADPSDGRAVRVTITAAGLERVREHRTARTARIAERLTTLSEGERRALLRALPALEAFGADVAPN